MSQISNNSNPVLSGYLEHTDKKVVNKLADSLEKLIVLRRKFEEAETKVKIELKDLLKEAYFSYNEDIAVKEDAIHTFDVNGLQVNFTNAYFIKDSAQFWAIVKLLGSNHPLVNHLIDKSKITVDVTNLEDQERENVQTAIISKAGLYGIGEEAVQIEHKPVVTDDFHGLRHVYLTKEDNLKVDNELPLVVQIAPIE